MQSQSQRGNGRALCECGSRDCASAECSPSVVSRSPSATRVKDGSGDSEGASGRVKMDRRNTVADVDAHVSVPNTPSSFALGQVRSSGSPYGQVRKVTGGADSKSATRCEMHRDRNTLHRGPAAPGGLDRSKMALSLWSLQQNSYINDSPASIALRPACRRRRAARPRAATRRGSVSP